MPALHFPTPDALRLALASGIVPPEIAQAPVLAAFDAVNRPWVVVPPGFPREVVAALSRLGVTLHGTGPAARLFSRWAELLPLRPAPVGHSGPMLVELPDGAVARLVAEVRQLRPQSIAVRLLPDCGRAWVILRDPPLFTSLGLADLESAEAFVQQAPRIWVKEGWRHPLENLTAPPDVTILLRPEREWRTVPDTALRTAPETYPLHRGSDQAVARRNTPTLPAVLTLRPTRSRGSETFWVLPRNATQQLLGYLRDSDERLLSHFQIAILSCEGTDGRVLLRVNEGREPVPVFLVDVSGFSAHAQLSQLHVPVGFELCPELRPTVLAETLDLKPDEVAWLEPRGQRFTVHTAPERAFRPLTQWVTYTTPPPVVLQPTWETSDLLATPKFVVETEHTSPLSDHLPPRPPHEPPRATAPASPEGWLRRLTDRLFRGKAVPQRGEKSRPIPGQPARRVGEKLSSRHSLLLGNEWAARRGALEQRVLTDALRLPLGERARLWANLAEVYAAVGNPADAAVCWLNAIWDGDPVPASWTVSWLRAEAKSARLGRDGQDLAAVLRSGSPRVASAHLVWAAGQGAPSSELVEELPRILGLIESHEPDLPVRMAWLAWGAGTALIDGDPLGLARCRDRLYARLAEKGPGLDLDAPSFLRFRGGTEGERFQTAKEWLVRVRDPLHRWLVKCTSGGRLQWAGLDPETTSTVAYADLMLAWALSRLGDRTRANELLVEAESNLADAGGTGVDPVVHRVLRLAFAERIRSAQDGRPDRPGLPLEAVAELPQLDDLGRYAVDKLRAFSRVLEPVDRVNPYRSRDLVEFLGTDRLGERLARVVARPDLAPDPREALSLLDLALDDQTAVTLPRTAFVLLEVAPRLEPALVANLLPLASKAVELVPEWSRLTAPSGDPVAAVRRFGARLLAAACHAAALFHLPESFRQLAEAIRGAAGTPDATVVKALELAADPFFRTLRRLGLTSEAADLLASLGEPQAAGTRELGLAVGWFATGNEDAGNRVLNAARDRLFVEGIADDRERTAVAIAYAAAVGHAPTRIALGRLEELFLRLDPVTSQGATNRYYTLKPLQLIDTVVRAVVSDDFALGPGVRGWLDDDEYLIRRRITRDLDSALVSGSVSEVPGPRRTP